MPEKSAILALLVSLKNVVVFLQPCRLRRLVAKSFGMSSYILCYNDAYLFDDQRACLYDLVLY